MDNNVIQILLSVLGAEAVTGAMESVKDSAGVLGDSLLKLSGVAVSLDAVMEGFSGVFEMSESLVHLSARTGQSIDDLVVLQRAFEKTGLSGDSVGIMANRLQKSLSGVNEMGQLTGDVFKQLGVNVDELKGESFNEQIEAIGVGFQKIEDPARRAALSMQLFGREGGQMLALLGGHALEDASDEAGRLGARMHDDAKAFAEASDSIKVMKLRLEEMFVAASEHVLPVLTSIGNLIKGLNLAPLGAAIGGGGGIAAATALATLFTSKFATAMESWATGSGFGNEFAMSCIVPITSGLTKFMTVALPAGIVVAVGGALISAISEAMVDFQNHMDQIRGKYSGSTGTIRKEFSGSKTSDDWSKAQADAQKQIDALNAEKAKLLPKQKEDEYNASIGAISDTATKEDVIRLQSIETELKYLQELANKPLDIRVLNAAKAKSDLADFHAQMQLIIADQEKNQRELAEQQFKNLQHPQQMAALGSSLGQIDAQLKAGPDSRGSDAENAAQKLNLENQREKILNQIREVQKQIAEDSARESELLKKKVDAGNQLARIAMESAQIEAHARGDNDSAESLKESIELLDLKKQLNDAGVTDIGIINARIAAQKALYTAEKVAAVAKKQDDAERDTMERGIAALEEKQSAVQGDYTRTADEKWSEEQANLDEQIRLHQEYLDKLIQEQKIARQNNQNAHADQLAGQITSAEKGLSSAQSKKNNSLPDPHNWGQQWTSVLTKFRGEWRITAKSVADSFSKVIDGAISSVSSNLSSLIEGTESWHDALRNIASTIESSIITAIVDAGVKQIASLLETFLFGEALKKLSLGTSAAEAKASTALWASPAMLASIASYGTASLVGSAALFTALGMAQGLAQAKTGGYFPGQDDEIAGVFHGNEYVFSAPAVRNIGAANLDNMHRMAMSSPARPSNNSSNGGGRSSRRSSGGGSTNVVLVDTDRQAKRLQRNSGNQTMIAKAARAQRGMILGRGR